MTEICKDCKHCVELFQHKSKSKLTSDIYCSIDDTTNFEIMPKCKKNIGILGKCKGKKFEKLDLNIKHGIFTTV